MNIERGRNNQLRSEVNAEVSPDFDPSEAVQAEKSVFEALRGRAKEISRLLLLVTSVSLGAGTLNEARAGETPAGPQVENAEKKELQLGSYGTYAQGVERAVHERADKLAAEQVDAFLRQNVQAFIKEFYFPTVGKIVEGPYGTKRRTYEGDDAAYVLKVAQELRAALDTIEAKFPESQADAYMQQVDDMIVKLQREASGAGQAVRDAIEKMQQQIGR